MTTNAPASPADYLDGYAGPASRDSGEARARYVHDRHGPAAVCAWYADALDLDPHAPQTIAAVAFLLGIDGPAFLADVERECRLGLLRDSMRAVSRRLAGYAEMRRIAAEYEAEGFGPDDFE